MGGTPRPCIFCSTGGLLMADKAVADAVARGKEVAERVRKEAGERLSKGRPTPTQEENDRTMSGEYIAEHEDDGSGPDAAHEFAQRQMEAQRGSGGGYQTRQATPRHTP